MDFVRWRSGIDLPFCVAGVALTALGWVRGGWLWRRGLLRGRRGTYGPGLGPRWLAVTPRPFAWQAWHLRPWAGSAVVGCDAAVFCVAGVALTALGWVRGGWLWRRGLLRGRRGTYGPGLGPRWLAVTPRSFAWQAWHLQPWAGSTVVGCDAAVFCVAGVALTALGWVRGGWLWRRGLLRGRRGTYGPGLGPRWLAVTPRSFAWQAWHLVTSTSLEHRFFLRRYFLIETGTAWYVA